MKFKAIHILLIAIMLLPATIWSETPADYNSSTRIQLNDAGEATEGSSRPGKGMVITGTILSATGGALIITSVFTRPELLTAYSDYYGIQVTDTVSDITNAKSALTEARLLYYIPLITGMTLSTTGLFLTYNGVRQASIYNLETYTPSYMSSSLGISISPFFTGIQLRY